MPEPPRYTQRMLMRARLGRGGYLHHDHILDGETPIGIKATYCEKRGGRESVTYTLGNGEGILPPQGAPTFPTATAFIAAYEAKQAVDCGE